MAKTFNNIAGIVESGKPFEIERFLEVRHILTDHFVVQELMSYMSVDELQEFNNHLVRHYDIKGIEEEMEQAFNSDIAWEDIDNG